VEHPREVVRGFENTGDGSWGLLGRRVCRRVHMENLGETRHMFIKNQLRHVGGERFEAAEKV